MKLSEAIIAWTPGNQEIGAPGFRGKCRVLHGPQPAEHAGGFSCVAGRGDPAAHDGRLDVRRRHIRAIANRMVHEDGLDAGAVHAALSAIEEYGPGLDEQPLPESAPR